MKKIFKFKLTAQHRQTIAMPESARILHADEQHDEICIWVEVDPDEKNHKDRMFETFGTGHEITEELGTERFYIGTVKLQGGSFVFHVYERLS